MSVAFYITFWFTILVLLVLAFIYGLFAYNTLGEISDLNDRVRLVEARDFLFWILILMGIALAIIVLFVVYSFAFSWTKSYEKPEFIFMWYMFFFVWFLAALVLLVVTFERLGGSLDILTIVEVQKAKRDVFVAIAGIGTIVVLVFFGYIGYSYRHDMQRQYTIKKYLLPECPDQ